jgi:general L-amino acid transport system permease protein
MSETHAFNASSYVRSEMLPPAAPPVSERGAVRWVRENLFSGPVNSVLTVLSLLAIYMIVSAVLPWLTNSVWNTNSLDECRQVLEGTSGACFSVITERWTQMLYGFYPPELYWRANTTLLLLFLALLPVLYDGVWRGTTAIVIAAGTFLVSGWLVWWTHWEDLGAASALFWMAVFAAISVALTRLELTRRYLLFFTPIFPFVMVWLVWGGTVWGPVGALLGFVFGYLAFRFLQPVAGTLVAVVAALLVPLLWWFALDRSFTEAMASVLPLDIRPVDSRQLGGFMISIIIGVSGIALSLPLGVVLALGRKSNLFIVKTICVGFIEFIRGVPLITLLFTASVLLNYFLPPGTNFDIVLRVIIMVTLFAAAYMAETIRGGLAALPKGQYEAADSLGLDYWKAQRLIIMPQALKISIPGIVNNFIGLFKDTTLVAFIGIYDIMGLTNAIRADTSWHGIYWELYIFVGLVFFVCCFGMSQYSQYLEQKLRTDHR